MTRIAVVVAIGGLAGWLACVGPIQHEYRLAPGRAHTPDLATALVVPINESADLPRGLEKGEAEVFALILAFLEERGVETQTVATERYREAAAAAFAEARRRAETGRSGSVSGSPSYADTVPLLLAELGVDANLVVVPVMALRAGESTGHTIVWDGVRRRDPGIGARTRLQGSHIPSGASLYVVVYERDGTNLFSGYGGLDLVFTMNFREARFDLIEDRLEDRENLREGVCIAFHPFFGEDVSCR